MEEPVADDSALLKPKPKREQTDKQKAVWAKAQQTRLANAQLKKDALAKAYDTLTNNRILEMQNSLARLEEAKTQTTNV